MVEINEPAPLSPSLNYYDRLVKLLPPRTIHSDHDNKREYDECINELIATEENYLKSLAVVIGVSEKVLFSLCP